MANTPQNLTFWYQEQYVCTLAQAAVILKYQLRYVIAMDFTFTSFRLSLLVMLVTAVSMVRLVLKRCPIYRFQPCSLNCRLPYLVFTKSVDSNFRAFCFGTGFKMACLVATVSKDKILEVNEAAAPSSTKKETKFGLSVFTW